MKLSPDSPLVQAHIGEALLWLKKPDDGLKALRRAVELEPGGAAAAFATALLEAHQQGAIGR